MIEHAQFADRKGTTEESMDPLLFCFHGTDLKRKIDGAHVN